MATATDVSNVSTGQATSPNSILGAVWRSYFFRKFLRALVTIFVVTTIIFFLVRLLPGNPIEIYVNQLIVTYGMPVHEAQDQAAALFAIDLDRPVILQYFSYLRNLVQGNLGRSVLSPGTTVTGSDSALSALDTVQRGTGAVDQLCVWHLAGGDDGLPAEQLSRSRAYRVEFSHQLCAGFSGRPALWSSGWACSGGILPFAAMRGAYSSGMQPGLNFEFFADALFHGSLPIATYVLTSIGFWMLSMKSNTISTLGEDYVTIAKGPRA